MSHIDIRLFVLLWFWVHHIVAIFLSSLVEFTTILKLVVVGLQKWVGCQGRKRDAFAAIYYEQLSEEVFEIGSHLFHLLVLCNDMAETKSFMTLSVDVGIKVVTFEGIFSKKHEEEQDTECPDIY